MAQTAPQSAVQILFANAAQVNLSVAIQAFDQAELSQRKPATRRWYAQRLLRMSAALGEQRPVSDIMEADIIAYYADLHHLSAFTIHGHGRAIKRFWRWLFLRNILSVDLGVFIHLPKLPRQGRKGISDENLKAILQAAASHNPRDLALLRFLESTGCRVTGVADLRLADLFLSADDQRLRRRAMVTEKGSKSRLVLMDEPALAALLAWLELRPPVDDDRVFLLRPAGVARLVERYKRRLGLHGPCSPHQWRHRWARDRISRGMSLGDASRLLGHSDIKVTHEFYADFDFETLQGVADRFGHS